MWYNKIQDRYIFVSTNEKWLITSYDSYIADNTKAVAFADFYAKNGLTTQCPHGLDYWLWTNGKWTSGTDLSVTLGKHYYFRHSIDKEPHINRGWGPLFRVF